MLVSRQGFCKLVGERERLYITAHCTHAQRHSGVLLQLKIVARAAVATNAQVLDVFGAPELRILRQGKPTLNSANNGESNTDGSRKDFFNPRIQVRAVTHYLVADRYLLHPWMLLDLHYLALFQIHICGVLLVIEIILIDIIGCRLGIQHMLDHLIKLGI